MVALPQINNHITLRRIESRLGTYEIVYSFTYDVSNINSRNRCINLYAPDGTLLAWSDDTGTDSMNSLTELARAEAAFDASCKSLDYYYRSLVDDNAWDPECTHSLAGYFTKS